MRQRLRDATRRESLQRACDWRRCLPMRRRLQRLTACVVTEQVRDGDRGGRERERRRSDQPLAAAAAPSPDRRRGVVLRRPPERRQPILQQCAIKLAGGRRRLHPRSNGRQSHSALTVGTTCREVALARRRTACISMCTSNRSRWVATSYRRLISCRPPRPTDRPPHIYTYFVTARSRPATSRAPH